MADGGKVIIKIDGDSKGFKSAMGKAKDIAGKAAKGIAAAYGAASGAISTGFGAVIKVGSDFEAQMSTVSAISGASAENMELLGAKAKEMGIKTAFSATEAGQAMEYMAMAGWKTEDMLNGVEGIMNLAAASGEDLAATSDIVTDAMTAFGLAADQSARFADVLAAASSNSNTNVGLMGETFKYVAPVAGAMGFSIEDTAVAIGLMANAGIKGSQAGTALRATLSRLAKPPKEAAEAMNALHLKVTNADGSFKSFSQIITELRSKFSKLTAEQKTTYAAMLGGQEAMSGLLSIVNASDNDFNKLTEAINASAGSAENMANIRLDNLQGQITLLKSSLEGLGVAVYESNNAALTGIVEQAKEYVNQMTEAFENGGFSGLIEQAGKVFGDMAIKIAEQAPKLVDMAGKLIGTLADTLNANAAMLGDTAINIVMTLVNAIITNAPTLLNTAVVLVMTLCQGLTSALPTLIPAAIKIILQLVDALFDNMDQMIDAGINAVLALADGLIMALPELIEKAPEIVQKLVDAIIRNTPRMTEAGGQLIGKLVAAIVMNCPQIVGAALKIVLTFVKYMLWYYTHYIPSIGINIVKGIWEGIKSNSQWLWNKLKSWVNTILEHFKALQSKMLDIGKNMVSGLWNGFKEKFSGMINKIKGLIDLIPESIKKVLGIHSPSRVMRDEVGAMITEGIAVGIEKAAPSLEEAIEKQKQTIVDRYKEIAQSAIDSIDEVAKAEDDFAKKLKGFGSLYTTNKVTFGDKETEFISLADINAQTQAIERYSKALLDVKARGNVPQEFFENLRDMSIEEGTKFAETLLAADDETFNQYMHDWSGKQSAADVLSKMLYADEAEGAKEEITQSFENFGTDLEKQGKENAQSWGAGFIEQIKQIMPNVMDAINSTFAGIVTNNKLAYAGADANTSNSYTSNYYIQAASGESTQKQIWALKNAEFLKKQRGY